MAIFVLNHLVILLSTTAAEVTIVDHFDVKNPFLYSNSKASPDLDVNFSQKMPILAFLTNFWWFWIWTIWQRCRNGQNYQISQCRQIWMWISPKIPKNRRFWRFWPILGKKDMEHLVTMSGHNKNPFLDDYFCSWFSTKCPYISKCTTIIWKEFDLGCLIVYCLYGDFKL